MSAAEEREKTAAAVRELGALPMPVGPGPLLSEAERLRLRVDEVERAYTFDTAELKRQLESAQALGARVIHAEQRTAELEAVLGTHRKDDQAEIDRLRARVAELEAEAVRRSVDAQFPAVAALLAEDKPAESSPRFVVRELGPRCFAVDDTATALSYDMRFTRTAAQRAADRRNERQVKG